MAESERYDVLVVGSGFGGSVAAHTLVSTFRESGENRRICLLERGRAYRPGDFPRTPARFARNFWQPKDGDLGLFDIWSFRGCEAVVSAGLGGGSLLYSNATVAPPAEWLQRWPIPFHEIAEHFEPIRQMLGAATFPEEDPFGSVPKARALREAAAVFGGQEAYERVPLAVSFGNRAGIGVGLPLDRPDYGSLHEGGRPRTSCTLCGQCNIGCNQGAKNSLDHTFLSQAKKFGLEIRTEAEVKTITPLTGGGYEIEYADHTTPAGPNGPAPNRIRLRCRVLILSAGTFGTTYLLLKNRDRALTDLSVSLGTRFSTNGDLLTWLSGARQRDDTGEPTDRPYDLDPTNGVPVTGALRGGDFYLEDAGYPLLLEWIIAARSGILRRVVVFLLKYLWARLTRNAAGRISGQLAVVLGAGTVQGDAMPLGAMGLDRPDGTMELLPPRRWLLFRRRRRLAVDWTMQTSQEYFDRVTRQMTAVAGYFGARLAPSALSKLGRTITVHPLGGCPMGTSPANGVCDQFGEVFGYENLFIADGSVAPSPIGANPSLTIAALGRRTALTVAQRLMGI